MSLSAEEYATAIHRDFNVTWVLPEIDRRLQAERQRLTKEIETLLARMFPLQNLATWLNGYVEENLIGKDAPLMSALEAIDRGDRRLFERLAKHEAALARLAELASDAGPEQQTNDARSSDGDAAPAPSSVVTTNFVAAAAAAATDTATAATANVVTPTEDARISRRRNNNLVAPRIVIDDGTTTTTMTPTTTTTTTLDVPDIVLTDATTISTPTATPVTESTTSSAATLLPTSSDKLHAAARELARLFSTHAHSVVHDDADVDAQSNDDDGDGGDSSASEHGASTTTRASSVSRHLLRAGFEI